jgi:hypothetical protein
LDIYAYSVLAALAEINTEMASALVPSLLISTEFTGFVEGEAYTKLAGILINLATAAEIDLATLRKDVLFDTKFFSLVFICELSTMLVETYEIDITILSNITLWERIEFAVDEVTLEMFTGWLYF